MQGLPVRSLMMWAVCAALAACGTADTASPANPQPGDGADTGLSDPLEARLVVTPNPIDLGTVLVGESASIEVRAENVGDVPLVINDLFVSGSEEVEVEGLPAIPDVLAVGDLYRFRVTYSPDEGPGDEAVLMASYRANEGDAVPANLMVPILAEAAERCVSVTHAEGYDFGGCVVGDVCEEVFTITNCADAATGVSLTIDEARWTGSHRYLELGAPPELDNALPLEALADDGVVVLAPQEARNVLVTFAPLQAVEVSGTLSIATDAGPVELPIAAQGVRTEETVAAVARCRVRGESPGEWGTAIRALALDYVECEADPGPEAGIVSYQWTLVEQPPGSLSDPTPAADERDVALFVDTVGRYTLRLDVTRDDGLVGAPAFVEVSGETDKTLWVELTWTTPADSDQTDSSGSDMDLHLLREPGEWSVRPDDTYYQNANPNWGDTTRTDDDPSVAIDDVNGGGPECIGIAVPDTSERYRVGVHAYSDHGYGPSVVRVRVFIDGILAMDRSRELDNSDNSEGEDHWEVARIDWLADEVVQLIDEVHEIDLP